MHGLFFPLRVPYRKPKSISILFPFSLLLSLLVLVRDCTVINVGSGEEEEEVIDSDNDDDDDDDDDDDGEEE